jgi:hypothetical protein
MGQWGNQPFESDGGLDAVFDVLDYLLKKVERLACGPRPRGSALLRDKQELAANVELLCLVAVAVYRPALVVPIRGLPLPPPEVIAGWRDNFLAHWGRLARRQLGATPAESERLGVEATAPLVRLSELSRRQADRSEATYREVVAKFVATGKRKSAKSSRQGPYTFPGTGPHLPPR